MKTSEIQKRKRKVCQKTFLGNREKPVLLLLPISDVSDESPVQWERVRGNHWDPRALTGTNSSITDALISRRHLKPWTQGQKCDRKVERRKRQTPLSARCPPAHCLQDRHHARPPLLCLALLRIKWREAVKCFMFEEWRTSECLNKKNTFCVKWEAGE